MESFVYFLKGEDLLRWDVDKDVLEELSRVDDFVDGVDLCFLHIRSTRMHK